MPNISLPIDHSVITCCGFLRQAELSDEIEEMERAKEVKNTRPKSASNVSFQGSDDSDEDEESAGGLSARAGSAIARPNAGGNGVSYEEFNV